MTTSAVPSPPATPTSPAGFLRDQTPHLVLLAARVVVGLLFAVHGAQKLFGWFPDPAGGPGGTPPLLSLPGSAGVLEFFGGILVAVGLFTRPVAFLLAGEMAVAYFMAHAPRGFLPVHNRGEPAVLFCFAFLLIWAFGPGAYALDALRRRGRTRV